MATSHFFRFAQYLGSGTQVRASVEQALATAKTEIPKVTSLRDLDNVLGRLYNETAPLMFLKLVAQDKDVRTAAQEAETLLQKFDSHWKSLEEVRRALQDAETDGSDSFERAKKMYEKDVLFGSDKVKDIKEKIKAIEIKSNATIAEDKTRVPINDIKELDGLPQSFVEARVAAAKEEGTGLFLTLDYPVMVPVMRECTNSEVRKRLFEAVGWKAKDNAPRLAELVKLRHELASALGFPSNTAMRIAEGRLVKSEEELEKWLHDMSIVLEDKFKKEMTELATYKQANESKEVQPWDVAYLQRQREADKFSVDHEAIRQHFPVEETLAGVIKFYCELFSLRIERVESGVETWHEDVRAYTVADGTSGQHMGRFYLDLFPRADKYSHAAVFPLAKGFEGSRDGGPAVCMVANFSRDLLRFSEVTTLAHECGHVMHAVCTDVSWARFGWTWSAVEMDFLEVPSMSLEKFLRFPQTLRSISSPPLDDEVCVKLARAATANEGWTWRRLIWYSRMDMALHGRNPPELSQYQQLFAGLAVEETNMKIPTDAPRFAAWNHMYSGYDSAYYSYLKSETLACLLFKEFSNAKPEERNEMGIRFRKEILAPCASRSGMDMIRNFLGRDDDEGAAFAQINLNQH